MNTEKTIILARKHLGSGSMESSARHCLAEAVRLNDNNDTESARKWALKSIAYSVGVFHPDYVRADFNMTDD